MRLEQFRYVTAIAECRSLSQAARDLFITQPTLSVSLHNLESELGFLIFHRSHMGMELTEKGKVFYQIALHIQAELEQVKKLTEPEEISREVNLAAAPVFCHSALLPLISGLRASAPDIILNVWEISRSDAVSSILDCSTTLSIGLYTDEEEKQLHHFAAQNRIVIEPLIRDYMFAYLPKWHPLAHDENVRMAQLEEESVLLLQENLSGRSHRAHWPHRESNGYYRFSERDSVMKAVSKNMGYAVLPGLMALDNLYVDTGLVAVLPLADGVVPVTMYLTYRSSVPLNSNEAAVTKAIYATCRGIQEQLKKLPVIPHSGGAEPPPIYY